MTVNELSPAGAKAPPPSFQEFRPESEALHTVLAGLPAQIRRAVKLRVVEGVTAREAAQQMGCSYGAIADLTHAGLAAIRQQLSDGAGSEVTQAAEGHRAPPARPPATALPDPRTSSARQLVDAARRLVAAQDQPDSLQVALAALPAEARRAVELRVIHGLSAYATARQMYCRHDRVQQLTTTGLAGLRAQLTGTAAPVAQDNHQRSAAQQLGDGHADAQVADSISRARVAVAQAHQRVAGQGQHAEDRVRAQQVARWQADDQAAAEQHALGTDRDVSAVTVGGAA